MKSWESRNETQHLITPLVLIERKHDECSGGGAPCLRTLASSAMLLGVGGVVVYMSPNRDPCSLGLTIGSFAVLYLLYHCLRIFEGTPPESPRRRTLKAAVWTLSTLLTVVFTYRVAVIMPLAAAVIIWSMAGISMLGGFFLLFIYDNRDGTPPGNDPHLQVDDEKPLKTGAGMPLKITTE